MKKALMALTFAMLAAAAAVACGNNGGASPVFTGPAFTTPGPLDVSPGPTYPQNQSSGGPAYSTVP